MKINMLDKNKKLISAVISLAVGLSASGLSHADATTDQKSGSFTYVVPKSGGNDQCPGPYESMAVTLVNNTTNLTPGHGSPVSLNIYYTVDDNRAYTGSYAYVEADKNTFPYEQHGVADPVGEYTVADTDWTTSGPIIGAYIDGKGNQLPIRNWSHSSLFDYYNIGYGKYNGKTMRVMTIYNKRNNIMDWTSTGNNSITVRLPVRSYELLAIEAYATDMTRIKAVGGATIIPAQGYPSGSETMLRFQATPASSKSGSLVNIIASKVGAGQTAKNDKALALKTFPTSTSIDLRTVDEITFTIGGKENISANNGQAWMANTGGAAGFYAGSDITVKYLKDKITGQTISCN